MQRSPPINQIDHFYNQVLKDFIERLFLAYRFKSAITSQQIDNLSNKVKEKLLNRKRLFQYGVQSVLKGQSGEDYEQKQLQSTQTGGQSNQVVKIEHQESDYHSFGGQLKTISEKKEPEVGQQENSEEDQSEEDDLKEFEKSVEVKEQEKQKSEVKQENDQDEQSDLDQKLKEDIMKESSKKIGAHIIATYNTKNKKHIPKVQKTKIDLENVFLRLHDRQIFYTKLQCEFSQADYSNIKL